MTDRREKERLFQKAVAKYTHWLSVIVRDNAPKGRWQDLKREIFMNLWKSQIDLPGACVKKTRKRHAVQKMKVGPSEPPCRRRPQTAISCFSPKDCGGERYG